MPKKKRWSKIKTFYWCFQAPDWCAPCIKLDNVVWKSEAFKLEAEKILGNIQSSIFQEKSQSIVARKLTESNNKLAEKYNRNGSFPLVILLDKTGKVIGMTGFKNISATEVHSTHSFLGEKMKKTVTVFFLSMAFVSFGQITHKRKMSMLGSPFEMTVVAKDSVQGNEFIDLAVAEVKRVEYLISDWIPTTQISQVNKNAGIKPVKVDKEVFDLVSRAIKVSQITSGAFDISYASMDNSWKFDGSMKSNANRRSHQKIGFQNWIQKHYSRFERTNHFP